MGPTFRFVAGKGGVGKTTVAAARAVALAGAGRRVLAVSTDPAHSLADALDIESSTGTGFAARSESGSALRDEPRAVPLDGPGELLAVELASGPAWERWLGPRRDAFRALAERGSLLDADDAARLLDLPVPGVDELVGLLELVRLAEASGCEAVIVDTAPTAHTLRLLRSPKALERLAAVLAAFRAREREVAEALTGRRGPLPGDEVAAGVEAEARALGELIRDPARARFTWVLLPEALSLAESRDALAELESAGATVDRLVVNRVTPPPPGPCRACAARRRAEAEVVREARAAWPDRPAVLVPEFPGEPRGIEALRTFAGHLSRERGSWDPEWEGGEEAESEVENEPSPAEAAPPPWLADVAPPGLRLLLFGGKGGVGKTTCAAAAALLAARAEPGRPVLLLSTDPAHSLADALGLPEGALAGEPRPLPGAPGNLRARELDAGAVFAHWKEAHVRPLKRPVSAPAGEGGRASARSGIDAPLDRAVFERVLDATPPGLDELVALSELLRSLVDGEGGAAPDTPADPSADTLVVVDTAPTGHALRLLEMPELALRWDHALLALLLKYREAVGLPADWAEELLELARRLKAFRGLLSDPARCRFVPVTRAGELPRRETERLLEALARLGVAAPALVVNAVPDGECARCRRAAERVREELERLPPSSILTAPARYPPPRGVPTLERWGRSWRPEPRP
ncbi:MAG TPA: ArsA family ATPase [Thermoanaerobaculia bacterium]|nr:ArsA family ATPase [Thermoanaerobaculia bacterium]